MFGGVTHPHVFVMNQEGLENMLAIDIYAIGVILWQLVIIQHLYHSNFNRPLRF